jgi:hypothetical protein
LRERVTITLSPRRVVLERFGRGLYPALTDRKTLACADAKEGANWHPAVEALREALTHPNVGSGDATVVLSNHFVRYLLLAWNADLVSGQEDLAFASARFQQVFGEAASEWALKLSHFGPGFASVASAIERALLEALSAVIAGSPLRLRSIQPGFMAVCNARQRAPSGNAWVAMAEPGRLLLGSMHEGRWQSLRARPLNGHAVVLKQIVEQECLLLGVESNDRKVYLHRMGDAPVDLQGMDVEPWLPEGPALPGGGAG